MKPNTLTRAPVFLFGKQQQADVFGGTSEGVETIKQALAQIERGGKTAGRLWHETLPQFRRSALRPTKIHSCAYEETQDRVTGMVGGNYENEQLQTFAHILLLCHWHRVCLEVFV